MRLSCGEKEKTSRGQGDAGRDVGSSIRSRRLWSLWFPLFTFAEVDEGDGVKEEDEPLETVVLLAFPADKTRRGVTVALPVRVPVRMPVLSSS